MRKIVLIISLLISISVCDDLVEDGKKAHAMNNDEKAMELYTKACVNGNLDGCYELGITYFWSISEKDKAKLLEILEKACDDGYAKSCKFLSKKYFQETGYKTTEEGNHANKRLFNIYKKSCDLNDAGSCYELGNLYYFGRGIQKDRKKANELYLKACNNNSAEGCFTLGNVYAEGIAIDKNIKKGIELLDKVCNMKDYTKSSRYRGCISCISCEFLGQFYNYGHHNLEKDKNIANTYYQKSIDLMIKLCDDGDKNECEKVKILLYKLCNEGYKNQCSAVEQLTKKIKG